MVNYMSKRSNTSLHKARNGRNDEFYTRMEYLPDGLAPYRDYLKHKKIYCCCDNLKQSSFVRYFAEHFHELELAGLTATCYCTKPQICRQMTLFGEEETFSVTKTKGNGRYWNLKPEQAYGTFEEMIQRNPVSLLKENGDFRSKECIGIMQEHDIIITNPPFSLMQEFLILLLEQQKDFIVLGNQYVTTYSKIFPLILDGKIHFNFSFPQNKAIFDSVYPLTSKEKVPEEDTILVAGVCWISTFQRTDVPFLELTEHYSPEKYPKFDNYDAVNVDKTEEIPCDYDGEIGVPVTFINRRQDTPTS